MRPSRSGQPQNRPWTNVIGVRVEVLAAIGAGLLAASVFLGIAAAPASQVHAPLANGQAGLVQGLGYACL
jgi:hypothetical protein